MTVEDIVEQMAFERIEPSGPLHLEAMLGQVCATVANVQRDPKAHPEPFTARDFMPALAAALEEAERHAGPIFIDDPEAMSRLIKERIFRGR